MLPKVWAWLFTQGESVEEDQGILSVGCPASASSQGTPALAFPADLKGRFRRAARLGGATLPRACTLPLRIAKQDYEAYLRVPEMDPDVAKRLPLAAKTRGSYSPQWEEELKLVDKRARALIRVSSVATTVAEHLGRQVAKDHGATSELFREVNLLAVLTANLNESSMGLAHRMSMRRRENACLSLQSLYGPEFAEAMKRSDAEGQGLLFGETFCATVEDRAKKAANESTLKKTETALTKGKSSKTKKHKRKKTSKSSSKRASGSTPASAGRAPASPEPAPTTAAPKRKRKSSKGSSGKPPKKSKSSKGGKSDRS